MIGCVLLLATAGVWAQRKPAPRKPPPAALQTEPAKVQCRETLGTGVRTNASYCFVLAGRDPAQGVIVTIPPHTGPATLVFNLHNRHTYSEEDIQAGRGFAQYKAMIGVLTMTGELLDRGAVQSEFRTVRDLFERIGGGAGPGGVKAVAPIGNERDKCHHSRRRDPGQPARRGARRDERRRTRDRDAGRPVAIVSNIQVEYRPGK